MTSSAPGFVDPNFFTSSGTQPSILLWDGRIDNRTELLRRSERLGARPESTDTEILTELFQEKGDFFPALLLGDFALALWDPQSRKLLLARDPLGVKPLYFRRTPQGLFFSRHIHTLLPHEQTQPDPVMIAAYLTGAEPEPRRTFFAGIEQVPPAHVLIYSPASDDLHLKRYWQPDPDLIIRYPAQADYENHFRDLFESAVAARLTGTAPIGNLLSGGLDSTEVTAMAEFLHRRSPAAPALISATWLCHGLLKEDWEAVRSLENRYGSQVLKLPMPLPDEKSNMEYFMPVGETPHIDVFTMPPFLLEALKEAGCSTLLTGIGGNELGFYAEAGYLQDLLLSGRLARWTVEIRRAARAMGNPFSDVAGWIIREALRENVPDSIKRLKRGGRPGRPKAKRFFRTFSRELCWRKLASPWMALGLNQMDCLAARFGMEIRHPFLDRRIVEFLLAVPGSVKTAGGYRKNFFQNALRDILPGPERRTDEDIAWIPDQATERNEGFIRGRLKSYLCREDAFIYNHVDRQRVREMLAGSGPLFWKHYSLLWRLVRLESWLQEFFGTGTTQKETYHERHLSGLPA